MSFVALPISASKPSTLKDVYTDLSGLLLLSPYLCFYYCSVTNILNPLHRGSPYLICT